MATLFDDLPAPEPRKPRPSAKLEFRAQQLARVPPPVDGWRPEPLPTLNGETRIILNCESTGLKWWDGDVPIGWAWLLPASGRMGYAPIRHHVGFNYNINEVRAWLHSLRGCHIENQNIKFDLHMARVDGVDFTELDCTFGDPAHYAALLDDHRFRFNLDQLSLDILGWDVSKDDIGKIPPSIQHEGEFKFLHPSLVEPYALRNVVQAYRLIEHFTPDIIAEDLGRVLQLEQEIIPVVVEMEKNGVYLDMDLLEDWRVSTGNDLDRLMWEVYQESGVRLSSPDSPKDLEVLFKALKLPITRTETGRPSFTADVMKEIQHPTVRKLEKAGHLADLKSKYVDNFATQARSDGWMRFNLHQLRVGRSEDDKKGTVSGRFSMAGDRYGGFNPQQCVAVEKQLERGWCPDYVVRKLFIPKNGKWLSADAHQIEYRIFAHLAKSAKVLAAYALDPLTDYHAVVMKLLHQLNATLNRKLVKNINFAKIYGAGLLKFTMMMGLISPKQYFEMLDMFGRPTVNDLLYRSPYADKFREALEIQNQYDEMFPEVKPMLRLAAQTAEHRGFVKTLLGRRARLTDRFHSALNRVIQGTAADINKRVLIEVYKLRRELGLTLRLTVHDEVNTDIQDPGMLPRVQEILNTQYTELRVPILWDAKVGDNWAAAK